MKLIDKDALVAEIERRMCENKRKSSLPQFFGMVEEDLSILSFINSCEVIEVDSMQEEPKEFKPVRKKQPEGVLKEMLDNMDEKELEETRKEMMQEEPDQRIQYASREAGIKAHAEDYSFNIESELFQQLTKEQQKLWRKDIEQAVLSGGYFGFNLAKDGRY